MPDFVLSNSLLEQMVDTTDEWITTRTGIKERRILKEEGKGGFILRKESRGGFVQKNRNQSS